MSKHDGTKNQRRPSINGYYGAPAPDTTGMNFPVRCTHCGGVYDVGKVEVTARYVDCSMWKSPCCGLLVDDRGDTGWKLRKDYDRIGW